MMPRKRYRAASLAHLDANVNHSTATRRNEYQQDIGPALPDWQPRPRPSVQTLQGRYCRLERIDLARHGAALYAAFAEATDGRDWTYMMSGPFPDEASYLHQAELMQASQDPLHYVVIDQATGRALGSMALMRIEPAHGVIEVGHIAFSPQLKRSRVATEAHYLLMRHVFEDLGYRRYEWKCDSLNGPSRRAAQRLGFCFEGIFRQAVVYRGRSRDTAWFSIIDGQWPQLQQAFQCWLQPDNFDAEGRQRQALSTLTAPATPTTPTAPSED
ncbi:GNAT family N-acetyltransferase [Herbaspirillum frisingense]|uniref:GNAT family N-acetyltransferase n=1 Tax=Herbaspirillum frisingense TaxID=92645 RepID=UPI001F1900AF|nr:GNAT family protein [Herbaspirillum frisingense]UIN19552.1 GNAT family N-acetyltransferase [Herbaspirillum frisingense]